MPYPYVRKGKSTGLKTASAIISGVPSVVEGIIVFTDGTNDATVTLYDNASAASGTVLAKAVVAAAELMGGKLPPFTISKGVNGIYAELSGVGASYIVYI